MAKCITIDDAMYYMSVASPDQMDLYMQTCTRSRDIPPDPIAAFCKKLGGIRINLYNLDKHGILISDPERTNWFKPKRGVWNHLTEREDCGLNDRHPTHLVLKPVDENKQFDETLIYNYENGDIVELGSYADDLPALWDVWDNSFTIQDTSSGPALGWYHLDGILFSMKPILNISPGEVWQADLLSSGMLWS